MLWFEYLINFQYKKKQKFIVFSSSIDHKDAIYSLIKTECKHFARGAPSKSNILKTSNFTTGAKDNPGKIKLLTFNSTEPNVFGTSE